MSDTLPSPLTIPTHDSLASPSATLESSIYLQATSLPIVPIVVNSPPPSKSTAPSHAPPLHQSQHQKQPSVLLKDFVSSQVILPPDHLPSPSPSFSLDTRYPLCEFVFYHWYSPKHLSFIANISKDIKPISFAETKSHVHWQQAMNAELEALQFNHT